MLPKTSLQKPTMRPKAPFLFGIVVTLATAAGLVLVLDNGRRPREEMRAKAFQTLVGGLGFGPAADLSDCPFAYDPRLSPRCNQDAGPIVGGAFFCPHHACSVFDYSLLEGNAEISNPIPEK
jgi:hypothetical protein